MFKVFHWEGVKIRFKRGFRWHLKQKVPMEVKRWVGFKRSLPKKQSHVTTMNLGRVYVEQKKCSKRFKEHQRDFKEQWNLLSEIKGWYPQLAQQQGHVSNFCDRLCLYGVRVLDIIYSEVLCCHTRFISVLNRLGCDWMSLTSLDILSLWQSIDVMVV